MYNHQEFQQFVPHKDPMFLLERMVECNTEDLWLVAEVEIRRDSPFFDPSKSGVPVWVAFEYMAQSIAALSGIVGKKNEDRNPRIGFIMGIRDFECHCDIFSLGAVLTVRVKQVFKDGPVVSFECQIDIDQNTCVTGIINAIEPETDEYLIKMGAMSA